MLSHLLTPNLPYTWPKARGVHVLVPVLLRPVAALWPISLEDDRTTREIWPDRQDWSQ
jgi:hypothetical protein